jgi:plastocyanin
MTSLSFAIRTPGRALHAVACLAGGMPMGLHAAALELELTDSAGKPLGDAVAVLEPAIGKAAVKPMADVQLSQAQKEFRPRVTLITTGTRVTFPNFDTVRHHVYSFSPVKTFELKLYTGVPGVPVVFDKPGVAVLGCNIHDYMVAWVFVADTPWSARSAGNGHARIDGVPPGDYRLRLWHPALGQALDAGTPLTVSAAGTHHVAHLPVSAQP